MSKPTFEIEFDDGEIIRTDMAEGITLNKAAEYYLGNRFTKSDETTHLAVGIKEITDKTITLQSHFGGTYILFHNKTQGQKLVQDDTDFPGVARSFGWSGEDNIEDARRFLDHNEGKSIEDPGYFD